MTTPATLAFLHAHGLDVEPVGLSNALRAALEAHPARYHGLDEGLSAAEAQIAAEGGLAGEPARDPLLLGIVAYAALLETGLTTQQVARRLKVTDARVRQRLADRTLLAIREGRVWKLPVFQFTRSGELPGWSEVCTSLPQAVSPVAVDRWLGTPHADLLGAGDSPLSPRRWLVDGRPPATVAALAAELA